MSGYDGHAGQLQMQWQEGASGLLSALQLLLLEGTSGYPRIRQVHLGLAAPLSSTHVE